MRLGGELRCPACGEASHERARFCTACGTPLPVRCPDCNEVNPRGARFCAQCGTRLPDASEALAKAAPAAERRQLSVMFCDLVDSTPLSGRLDPEDLAEVIRTYQSRVAGAIALFGGYIARYVGDGILSYFGWPEGGEGDPERAVRAALAVVAAVAETPIRSERLQVRLGIATGVVVVGETIGFGEALQQTAIGETPNLAARLQAIAGPDGIVIDDATRRQVGSLFTYRDLGEIALRGFRAPVRAWRVLGDRAVDDRFAALHAARLLPLVDREEELPVLLRCWQRAAAGEGQLVMLAGEAGIGKSRLVAELRARLRREPHGSLRYFCSPHYQASPLHPVIARWEHDAGFDRRDGPADRLRKLEAVLLPTGASGEDIALIADLLGVPVGDAYPRLDLSPQRKKQKTFEVLTRGVVTLARERPVLLFVEDAHWIDPSSLELLDSLMDQVLALRVLVIVSYRPEFAPPWVGRSNATLVTLGRLNPHDAMRLATEVMIGQSLLPAPLNRIIAQSDGVPLFIEELTKAVLENAAAATGAAPTLAVPDTLQALLTARLDKLPAAKRVAQIGAAIGREFSRTLLAAVAEMPEPELAHGLEELVGSGLALRTTTPMDPVYTFKHALVQDAVYDSLLRRRRVEIHARIVAAAESDASLGVAEPGLLGHHCAQAGLLSKAASYYRIAGGRSAERAAVAETRIYLERGLQFAGNLPDGPDRHHLEAELLMALGRILMVTNGPNDPEANAAFERAVAVCRRLGSPEVLARALYSVGVIAETRADLRAGQAIGEELAALAASSGNAGIAIAARVRLGIVAYYRGRFVAARDHLAEALALCATGRRELRDIAIASDPDIAEAYLSVALAHLGCAEQAIAHGRSAVEGARRSGASSHALVLSLWSRTLEVLRDEAGCGACAAMLVALCEEQGFAFLLAVGQCQLGWSTARQGDIARGVTLLSAGIATARELGARIRPEMGKYLLSDALALAGRRDEALAMLDEVLRFSRETDAGWLDAELHRKKGELLASLDADAGQAEQEFLQAIDIAHDQSARLFELRAAVGLARLCSARGRQAAARDLLRRIYAWFGEGTDVPDVQEARALLAEMDAAAAPN
jgi:class 3 adenylate cyclase/tetratricopeptide (TPR) repeat protein